VPLTGIGARQQLFNAGGPEQRPAAGDISSEIAKEAAR
jgi:hypothetical protein